LVGKIFYELSLLVPMIPLRTQRAGSFMIPLFSWWTLRILFFFWECFLI
jgi:hypothetical protein